MNLPAKTRLPPSNRRVRFHRPSVGKCTCTGFLTSLGVIVSFPGGSGTFYSVSVVVVVVGVPAT